MTAYRYWRLYVTEGISTGNLRVGSMELRASAGGANLSVTGSGTASAISDGGGAASQAFDNNRETTWGSGSGAAPWWLTWDFGVGISHDIQHLTLINPNDAEATSAPKNAKLQGSDNNSSWSDVITVLNHGGGYGASYVYLPPATAQISVSAPSPTLVSYSGTTANITPPAAWLVAYSGGAAALAAPGPTLKSFGAGGAYLTSPAPTLYSAGRSSLGDNSFVYTAPRPALSAFGGASIRLRAPGPALTTTATFVGWGKASVSAPSTTIAASGTVSGTGQAALTLSTPYKLVGYSGAVASITLTGGYTVQAKSTAGSIGGAAITCPLFELTASGTAQNYGSANLLAPAARLGAQAQAWLAAPGATLTAIGSAVITATYEAYAVNLLHPPQARGQAAPIDETTRYTNFPFTHVVRYRNSYYGANSTGLYLLEGTTDDGVDIPYTLRTAISDFKSPFRKTVASAYFGGRLGPGATMTLYAGEGAQTQAYSYTTPRGALAQNYRQAFGKGIRQHRYYAVGISGTDALALDSLELDTHNSTRRI